MVGGAWFDEYVANKSNEEIFSLAYKELKSHLHLDIEPDYHDVAVIKVCMNKIKL